MREMDRIREKSVVVLESRQIGWLIAGGLIVAGGVFAAGYRMGLTHAPNPPVVTVLDSPQQSAEAATPAPVAPVKAVAPAKAADDVQYTYDKRLTEDSPPVEVYQDKTMKLVAKKREEFLARSRQGDMALAGPSAVDSGPHASSAFAGRRLPAGPRSAELMNARPAVTQAPMPAAAVVPSAPEPTETELEAAMDRGDQRAIDSARRRAEENTPASGFTIQIKAFRSRTEAANFMQILRERGYKPYMVAAEVEGRGRFYRVRLGKFRTLEAAQRRQSAFEKAENLETIVTKML